MHPQRSPWPESLQRPRRSRRVVHQRADSARRATPVADSDGRDATPCLLTAPNRLHTDGRVTARDVPPVDFLLSRKVECHEAPSDRPGDTRVRAQAGDGVDPRDAVAVVPTAQADRECCHAHAGMGAWIGQHLGGVHVCLTIAGASTSQRTSTRRRGSHPAASYFTHGAARGSGIACARAGVRPSDQSAALSSVEPPSELTRA